MALIFPYQICKDKAEAEVWIAGLKALTSTSHARGRRTRSDIPDVTFSNLDPSKK